MTVGVLTFHRPHHITEVVRAVHDQILALDPSRFDAQLVVVDNDPGGSASEPVLGLGLSRVRYVIEPTPGIAAGRNRALAEAAGSHVVLFLDDDGRPGPRWLELMLEAWLRSRPAAVAGWVDTQHEGPVDAWIQAGGFFERRRWEDGQLLDAAACGNLLIDLDQLGTLRFLTGLGLAGGEDTLLTRQLVARGGRIVFCRDAVVVDIVSTERVTRRWVLIRSLSHGNQGGLLDMCLSDSPAARLTAGLGGLARIGGGAARAAVGVLGGSQRARALGARTAMRGVGMTLAALGLTYNEYARDRSGLRRLARAPEVLRPGNLATTDAAQPGAVVRTTA